MAGDKTEGVEWEPPFNEREALGSSYNPTSRRVLGGENPLIVMKSGLQPDGTMWSNNLTPNERRGGWNPLFPSLKERRNMKFHAVRIRLANWLTGTRMDWNVFGDVIDTPYTRLCGIMETRTKDHISQVNKLHAEAASRSLEITKMHRAFARKNRQIERLKQQLKSRT